MDRCTHPPPRGSATVDRRRPIRRRLQSARSAALQPGQGNDRARPDPLDRQLSSRSNGRCRQDRFRCRCSRALGTAAFKRRYARPAHAYRLCVANRQSAFLWSGGCRRCRDVAGVCRRRRRASDRQLRAPATRAQCRTGSQHGRRAAARIAL